MLTQSAIDIFAPPAPASVQSCLPHPFRWQDLCGAEAGGAKHLPLDPDDNVWLTLGGELREREEAIDHPEFGVGSDPGYAANDVRALFEADLRSAAGPRAFVQLATAGDWGRRPGSRPFDQSLPDLQQGFVDIPFRLAGSTLAVRVGRQEVDLGDDRLVAVREPANLRLAFDMALARLDWRDGSLIGFVGRPVVNLPGAFDDHSGHRETFSGATLQFARPDAPIYGAVFGFERDREYTLLSTGAGPDRRLSLGARLGGRVGDWDGKAEVVHQSGGSIGERIDAIGVTFDTGWTWRAAPWKPRLSLVGGYASGDRNLADGKQGDFDSLYPNLGYFTDAPVLYPRNVWDVAPTLRFSPRRSVTMTTGLVLVTKLHRQDSLYDAAGLPLPDAGTPASLAGALPYVSASWSITPHIVADGALVAGEAASALSRQRVSSFTYGLGEIAYRF